ncbi:MAG: GntR family transcriptional regulator [Pseudomonadota bacterium]
MTAQDDGRRGETRTQRAATAIRELIFEGKLAAGSSHLESELADQLGMSRTPVREAMLMLELQGLIEVRPRKGARVLPVSPTDMADIYEVVIELESVAAGRAAAQQLDAKTLAPLAAAIDDMDAALRAQDREAWAVADDRFHAALVALGGNSRIKGIVEMMADQMRRARNVTLHLRPLPTDHGAACRELYRVIASGDAEGARKLHREQRRRASAELTGLLERNRLETM